MSPLASNDPPGNSQGMTVLKPEVIINALASLDKEEVGEWMFLHLLCDYLSWPFAAVCNSPEDARAREPPQACWGMALLTSVKVGGCRAAQITFIEQSITGCGGLQLQSCA